MRHFFTGQVIKTELLVEWLGQHGIEARRLLGSGVRAAHERGVERNHIEQRPETELAEQELAERAPLRPEQLRVVEQLARVVAGLAVDIDGAREVGRLRIVEPPAVGEPAVGGAHAHDVARTGMIESGGGPCGTRQRALDAVDLREQHLDAGDVGGIAHRDMGDLVVGDGECCAVLEIEDLAPVLKADREQSGLAEHAIEPHGISHGHDAVLADDERQHTRTLADIEKPADHAVDLAQFAANRGVARSGLLQRVVEVGQVRKHQRRRRLLDEVLGGHRDPVGRLDARGRPPVLEQGKLAEASLKRVAQCGRLREAVGNLAAVGLVDGAWREHRVGRRMHRVPPARVRTGEGWIDAPRRLPDLFASHKAVRLLPELHLAERPIVPAVADDPVIARSEAREHGRLRGAGHRRKRGTQRAHATGPTREVLDAWRRLADQVRRERDDIEDADALDHAWMVRLESPARDTAPRAGPAGVSLVRSCHGASGGAKRKRVSTRRAFLKTAIAENSGFKSIAQALPSSRNSMLRTPASAA